MSYKSLVVHLDTSERAPLRLDLALRIARRFDAHLTGLFATFTPDPGSFYVMAGSAEYFAEHARLRNERRGAIERLFHAETLRARVSSRWVAIGGHANQAALPYVRCADLTIIGQSNPDDPETFIDEHFPERLVLAAGKPVLVIPRTGSFPIVGERVLVAWDGSREATRAAHDALPFLARAKRTLIATVADKARSEPFGERIPGADAALMLARHAPDVDVVDIAGGPGVSVGDALLSRAYESGADLMVMGAYGHARWRELLMGGTTRTVLASMTLPVLMSH
ncbi:MULTISPECIES: universal stress protein [Burkholderia]|uniref:universal stress protein n=1 Tax=Burkholderia TaxID=32008 RepID=UPI000841BA92|nr:MULTISPECIES: universal stress protein [unclassified Burkholderia]AOK32290.1 universal stress protein UspA [Burkholderia sp. Bp7605]